MNKTTVPSCTINGMAKKSIVTIAIIGALLMTGCSQPEETIPATEEETIGEILRLDPASGLPSPMGEPVAVPRPVCVLPVPAAR